MLAPQGPVSRSQDSLALTVRRERFAATSICGNRRAEPSVPGISKSKRKGVSIPRSGSRSGKTILSLAARSVNSAESCIRTAATASMRRHGARRTPDAVLFRLFTGFSSVCVRRNPFRRVGFRRELSRGVVTRRMFIKLEAAGIAPAAPIYQFVLTIASVEPLVSDLFSITQTPAVPAYLARFGPTTPMQFRGCL